MKLSMLICIMSFSAFSLAAAPTSQPSLRDAGDPQRLLKVFQRAEAGERITVGVLGGSITQGYAASTEANRYANRVTDWWQANFPKSKVTLVSAGIGATGSDYGCLRVKRDLLSKKPDFIIVEFSVNDANTQHYADTYEGLVRDILSESQAAVLLLFMTQEDHTSAQSFDEQIGAHYHLPMISYRDGLFAKIDAGEFKWKDISPDNIHPNDRGMKIAAGFITSYLAQAMHTNIPVGDAGNKQTLPPPLFTDLYQSTELFEGDELKPIGTHGFSFDTKDQCWRSDQPGSTIDFQIAGRSISLLFYRIHQNFGQAAVTVDGGKPQTLDGWFDQTWGGKRELMQLADDLHAERMHSIHVELLQTTSPESRGHEFRIFGIGAAGGN